MKNSPIREFRLEKPSKGFEIPQEVDFEVIADALSFHLPKLHINSVLKPLKNQSSSDLGTKYICVIISRLLALIKWKNITNTKLNYILQPLLKLSSISSPIIAHDKIWQLFAFEVALSTQLIGFEFSLEQASQNFNVSDVDLFIYPNESVPMSYLPTSHIILPSGIHLNGIAYQFKSVMTRKKIPKKIIQASKQLKPFKGGIVGIDISTLILGKNLQKPEKLTKEFNQIVIEIEKEMSNPNSSLHKNTSCVAGIDICCRFFESNTIVYLRWIIWNKNYNLGFGLTARYQTIGNFYGNILQHPFSMG